MRKAVFVLLGIWVFGVPEIRSQNSLSLKACYDQAATAAPLSGDRRLHTDIWGLRDQNATKGWYPSLDASWSMLYQSSVVDMSEVLGTLPVPGLSDLIQPLPHDQYKLTLDINQAIYDGGAIHSARSLEKNERLIAEKQNEIDLYSLRNQVNQVFFGLLVSDKQEESLRSHLEVVVRRIQALKSGVAHGVVRASDLDLLFAEKLRLEQLLHENAIRRTSQVRILSSLIGTELEPAVRPALPEVSVVGSQSPGRPELQWFDLRKASLEAGAEVLQSRRRPKAFGFATLGYGNPPGGNFFKDEFAPYFVVGAGVKWNLWDWGRTRNDRQVFRLQSQLLDNRKKDLEDQLQRLLEAKQSEIESLTAMIQTDTALLALRKKITATAESQHENGVITVSQYLSELNAEKQVQTTYDLHTINLARARVEYLNISGHELE